MYFIAWNKLFEIFDQSVPPKCSKKLCWGFLLNAAIELYNIICSCSFCCVPSGSEPSEK